jgi:hypothetical protein
MPDMPGHIARPRFLRLHDAYLNESREHRRRFGQALFAGDSLADAYRHLRIGSSADWRHLEREFYADEEPLAYWPYNRFGFLGNKQEILRQGALEAIRVAEGLSASQMTRRYFDKPWPDEPPARRLESWWVCMGDHCFEIDVLDGELQVTMMIMTPRMPFLPDKRKPKLEKDGFIWTVAHRHLLEEYLGEYRKDQDRYPKIEPVYRIAGHDRRAGAGQAEQSTHGDHGGHGGHHGHDDRHLGRLEKFTD